MQQFEIILKNEKIKSYRFLALILVLLNVAIFIFLLAYGFKRYESAAALLLLGTYLFIKSNIAKRNNQKSYPDEIVFFVLAGCWVGLQNYLLCILCILLGVLYHASLQKLKFIFNTAAVQKLNFPKAEYQWNLFTNVMIKDKILTLDLKNNKLMQMEIEHGGLDELSFNKFARQQIDLHNIAIK